MTRGMAASDTTRTVEDALEAQALFSRISADDRLDPEERTRMRRLLHRLTADAQRADTSVRVGISFLRTGKVAHGIRRFQKRFLPAHLPAGRVRLRDAVLTVARHDSKRRPTVGPDQPSSSKGDSRP